MEFEATFEGGVLKPLVPVPFAEHQRVVVTVKSRPPRFRDLVGLIPWKGTPEQLEQFALDPDAGPQG